VTGTVERGADRYARARLIEGWDPRRLAGATAIVAGVGALGNEVAKNLALAGVGRLVLCDPDTVAVTNLSRTVLFGAGDVGRPKPLAAAAELARLAPDATIDTRCHDLTSGVGLGELSDAGVVLGCLDSVHARMALLGRCALVDAPLVDGGTGSWTGEVRLRLHLDEPCFACTLSAHQRGVSDLPWSCADPPAGPAAASIVATSLVAAWMTLAALRILLGTPPEFRLVRIDGLAGRAEPIGTTRDPQCPHHRALPAPEPIDVDHRHTVGDLLAALAPGSEPTAWTRFPLPMRCVRCGPYDDGPNQAEERGRDGVFRCPGCGSLIRTRFSERLRDADPALRLCDLGIAPEEILTIGLPEGGHQWRRLKLPDRETRDSMSRTGTSS
jgi:molybdopterin-synthase adenylyltransferase